MTAPSIVIVVVSLLASNSDRSHRPFSLSLTTSELTRSILYRIGPSTRASKIDRDAYVVNPPPIYDGFDKFLLRNLWSDVFGRRGAVGEYPGIASYVLQGVAGFDVGMLREVTAA